MNESSAVAIAGTRYELRFTDLFHSGRGFAFPCDAAGRVDVDRLSRRGRSSYAHARDVAGIELSLPVVMPVA